MMVMRSALALAAVLTASSGWTADPVRIALPDEPNGVERFAAQELRAHLEMTGLDRAEFVFRLGRAAQLDLAGLGPCEAKVRIADKVVDIAGVDGTGNPERRGTVAGTLFGVYDFLERKCGVRWLWPGELGTVVVGKSDLSPCEWTVRPMAFSEWRTSNNLAAWAKKENGRKFEREQNLWLRRHRFSLVGGLAKGHAFTDYWKRFSKTHPEYFNELPNGVRRPDPFYQFGRGDVVSLCPTCPGVVREKIAEWQAAGDLNDIINGNENDVAGKCCCDRCLAADGTGDAAGRRARAAEKFAAKEKLWWREIGSTSGRYAAFYKALLDEGSKLNPNCRVIGGIYANYSEVPPEGTTLGERVILRYCPPIMYPWTDKKVADFKRIWEGWAKTGAKLMMRPNFLLDGYNFPLVYYRWFADCYKFAAANGLYAQDLDALTGMYGANGLTLYVVAALNGDPTRPLAALENDYFAAFGKAAEKIRAYMAHFEDVTVRGTTAGVGQVENMEGGNWANFFTRAEEIFTQDEMKRGFALLAEADAAENDPLVRRRIDFLRTGLTDACLVQKTQRGFSKWQKTGVVGDFANPYRKLLAYRAAHEHLGYAGRSTMEYLEGRIWPVYYGAVGESAVELTGWECRIGDEAWRPATTHGWLKNKKGVNAREGGEYRVTFDVKDATAPARLVFGAVDGEPIMKLNGETILSKHPVTGRSAWKTAFPVDVTGKLRAGANELWVSVSKGDGPRGLHRPVFIEEGKVR